MNCVNFPESNMPLGAGDNPNTIAIRVMLNTHEAYRYPAQPDPKTGEMKRPLIPFYCAKLEFDEQEMKKIRDNIEQKFSGSATPLTPEQLDMIMQCMPAVYLNCMHSFVPITLTTGIPTEFGYQRAIVQDPRDN